MKNVFIILFTLLTVLTCTSCSEDSFDYNSPDVDLFVKMLKAGTYNTKSPRGYVEVPNFCEEDIPQLLKYSEDLNIISSFPLPPVSAYHSGKARLGECMLWIIESIRLGSPASMGCKMVEANAPNYEGIYFLTDQEVLDAAARYRRWWEGRQQPSLVIDPYYDEPLCGSNYRWW